ncbi:MAG: hypothetical protein KKC18_06560, partial [Chloroflexi bacterium]|nr:hypothetical protein [Chloroflexota bacterium]
ACLFAVPYIRILYFDVLSGLALASQRHFAFRGVLVDDACSHRPVAVWPAVASSSLATTALSKRGRQEHCLNITNGSFGKVSDHSRAGEIFISSE